MASAMIPITRLQIKIERSDRLIMINFDVEGILQYLGGLQEILAIHIATMTNFDHCHYQLTILYFVNNTIITEDTNSV
jgi:hypothetical protein